MSRTHAHEKPSLLQRLTDRFDALIRFDPNDLEGSEERLRTAQIAVLGAVVVVCLVGLVLVLRPTSGDAPVRAHAVHDPTALRPVDVGWTPRDVREGGTSTGGGGMSGSGWGNFSWFHREAPPLPPCEPLELQDAVRQTSGLRMITGARPPPCAPQEAAPK